MDVDQVREALNRYHTVADQGPDYYAAAASGCRSAASSLEFGDLAWAVLLAGQPKPIAAQALLAACPIDISRLPPDVPLHNLDADDSVLEVVGDIIMSLREFAGIDTAVATKVLHPLRPQLVPVIDRQSFFGTYFFNGFRLGDNAAKRHARHRGDVDAALKAIHRLVSTGDNAAAWDLLEGWMAPDGRGPFTRIQLFDMLWWTMWHLPDVCTWSDGPTAGAGS
jgi:hypothetical protein